MANLLVGVTALPADPIAHTRLPALLKYAPEPSLTAVYGNGERIRFPVSGEIAQAAGAVRESGGLKYLEACIPSEILRSVEILDLPSGWENLAGCRIDGAIWTTVATQAWRESERAQWARVPQAIRGRSLLAVTFCDMIAGGEYDLKRLASRLETYARPYFREICLVADGGEGPATAASRNKALLAQVQYLAQEFATGRLSKVARIAGRLTTNTLGQFQTADGSVSPVSPGKANRLSGEDWVTALSGPLPQATLDKPAILLAPQASGAAKHTNRKGISAPHTSFEDRGSGKRSPVVIVGAATLLAGAAVAGAIQLGLFGTGLGRPESNPVFGPSEAVDRSTETDILARRKAEAEAAAAEAHRKADAEAAAAEARRKAEAEAAAAEARRKAEAEAATAEARRKAEAEAATAEARRKAEAEAATAEARRKAEAEAAAAEAGRRRRAAAEDAERRRQAVPLEAPRRSNSPIIHGESD